MTTDQIIAAVGDLASFAAAIAAMAAAWGTFRTVKQMQQQTVASYRPTFAFVQTPMTASAEGQGWPIPSHWTKGRASDTQTLAESQGHQTDVTPPIKLYNVGLGSAVSVTIVWTFPVAEFVEKINKLAQRALVPAYFEYKSETVSCKSKIWPISESQFDWCGQESQEIDYVMPESTSKDETLVTIPYTISFLVSAYLYFSYIQKSDDEDNDDEADDILSNVAVFYSDIGGNRYDVRFTLEFNMDAMMKSKEGSLTVWFHVAPRLSETPPVIERSSFGPISR